MPTIVAVFDKNVHSCEANDLSLIQLGLKFVPLQGSRTRGSYFAMSGLPAFPHAQLPTIHCSASVLERESPRSNNFFKMYFYWVFHILSTSILLRTGSGCVGWDSN